MDAPPLPVTVEADGPFAGIGTLTLEQPGKPVIVLDLPLFQRLDATLKSLPRSLRGLVLASSTERAFVAGADLKSIMDMNDDQLDKYLAYGASVMLTLSQLPCPTAAAINGAVLGGGLELAMHCDGLIGAPAPSRDGQPAKPYPVGLPEAGLCICPGWGGTNLLPARIDAADAIRRTASGTALDFEKARAAGMFDATAPESVSLLQTAKAWLVAQNGRTPSPRDGSPSRWIGRPDKIRTIQTALEQVREEVERTEPGRAVADAVGVGLSSGYGAALACERRHLIRLRGLPAGKEAIAAFFARSSGKK